MFTISQRPTISEIHHLYETGKAKPSEVTQFFLNRSKTLDKEIHSVLRYTEARAYSEAELCDQLLAKTTSFSHLIQQYPLFGIPYNLKDNMLVEGEIATSASRILETFVAPYSSTMYNRLHAAGAILISQSNLDEWAVGSSTENSAYGATKNPFDTSRVPGGSSGGPAAVVASGQVVFSLGSDTGGSIRVPAAFCDVVGVKPTYGLVSRYGIMPLASSLDQVGPFTNSVADNALVLSVLSGLDENDQTTLETSSIQTELHRVAVNSQPQKPLSIGIPEEYFGDGMDETIRKAVADTLQKLQKAGHTLVPVSLPLTKYGLAVYYTTMTVETAANLQRFDGVRFGSQFQQNQSEDEQNQLHTSVRKQHFGDEPKRRIMLGTFTSSATSVGVYHKSAAVKEAMTRDFENVFQQVDVLVAPVTPEFPFKFGDKTEDPVKMYLSDALVYGANLCKIPAISVPLGFFNTPESQSPLPTGIQIMAPEQHDVEMYKLAKQIEGLKSE